jgi:WD40 repeat protein
LPASPKQADRNSDQKISHDEFQEYSKKTPELVSWIKFFDCGESQEEIDLRADSDLENECDEAGRDIYLERSRDVEGLEKDTGSLEPFPVKSWMGTCENTIPTNPPPIDSSVPDVVLNLDWVYGFQAQKARNNAFYTADGRIVYHTACVGLVYDPLSHKQAFNLSHADEIVSLAIHPKLSIIATGESGKTPRVCIWSTKTENVELIAVLRGFHKRAVTQLTWSPSGRRLVTIGQDKFHSVAVYQWTGEQGVPSSSSDPHASPELVFAEKSVEGKVLDCCFTADNRFVTGIPHINQTSWVSRLEPPKPRDTPSCSSILTCTSSDFLLFVSHLIRTNLYPTLTHSRRQAYFVLDRK